MYGRHERGYRFIKILIKKSEGEKPLERPRHRWENNIKKKVTLKAIV